jgi:hypothetical protein
MSQRFSKWRPALIQGHWRFVVLAAAFLFTIALFTGFSAAKSTYLITDEDLIYTVEGYSSDSSEAFIRAGIVLNADDTFEVTENDDFINIRVIRTVVTSQASYESIPCDSIRRANPELAIGTERIVQEGADGTRTTFTDITTVTGQEPIESFVGVTVTKPTTEIIEYGTMVEPVAQSVLSTTDDILMAVDEEAGTLTTASGQTLPYSAILTCTATAYTTERQSWKITATGTTARLGAIAVDPKIIPYGTKMYIVSADGSITYAWPPRRIAAAPSRAIRSICSSIPTMNASILGAENVPCIF